MKQHFDKPEQRKCNTIHSENNRGSENNNESDLSRGRRAQGATTKFKSQLSVHLLQ